MIQTNTNRLLDLTIRYGIDLWVFNEVFIDTKCDYTTYINTWKDVSRIKLDYKTFTEVQERLTKYIKKGK